MKKLPFRPKRVWIRSEQGLEWGGVTCGHFVSPVRHWFTGKTVWIRCYRVRVLGLPASDPYSVQNVPAERVRPWALLSDSPAEYDLSSSL